MKYNVGDRAFLVESNRFIREGTVVRVTADMVMFRFTEGGGLRVRENRLYPSKEEAEAAIQQVKKKRY